MVDKTNWGKTIGMSESDDHDDCLRDVYYVGVILLITPVLWR